jgi:hypothetical protein
MRGRTWDNQFTINEEMPLTVPERFLDTDNWKDESWGNETSPRFTNQEFSICIWVDYDNPADREIDDSKKFTVVELLDDEGHSGDNSLLETDDENEVFDFITKRDVEQQLVIAIDALTCLADKLHRLPNTDYLRYTECLGQVLAELNKLNL